MANGSFNKVFKIIYTLKMTKNALKHQDYHELLFPSVQHMTETSHCMKTSQCKAAH